MHTMSWNILTATLRALWAIKYCADESSTSQKVQIDLE